MEDTVMVLTINPADAQAIQEDEMQLLSAILQATRGAITFLNSPPPPAAAEPPEAIRIQMGRRLVYGWLADGQFRNELDANKMQAIFDAIQRPVAPEVDASSYKGKVPAIEIRDGDRVLFREERDGTVTANAIQFQLAQEAQTKLEPQIEQAQATPAPAQAAPSSQAAPQAESPIVSLEQAERMAQTADYLLNPLKEQQPIYDAVSVKGYQIRQDENGISVSRDGEPILAASNGEITTNRVTQQDWDTFQRLEPRPNILQSGYHQNGKPVLVQSGVLDGDTMQHDLLDAQQNKRNGIWANTIPLNQDSLTFTADAVDAREIKKTQFPDAPIPRDTGSLTVDVAPATQHDQTLPAIAVLERATARLPAGPTQQLLQTTARDWNQQVQGLQQGLRQGLGWLAAKVDDWRHQQVARAALDLFNRGYERTGERSYQLGEYSISLTGRNLYTLRGNKGELMRFQAFKSLIPGLTRQSIQVLSTSVRLGSFQGKELQAMHRSFTPQGDLDVEAVYNLKTKRVEQIVTQFLQTKVQANVWDKEGGKFKLEIGDGGMLRITDKQEGRGVVFQREAGQVFSQLGARDFAHFDRLAAKMQQSEQTQPQQTARVRQSTAGLELS
jgi:hypothetical protein